MILGLHSSELSMSALSAQLAPALALVPQAAVPAGSSRIFQHYHGVLCQINGRYVATNVLCRCAHLCLVSSSSCDRDINPAYDIIKEHTLTKLSNLKAVHRRQMHDCYIHEHCLHIGRGYIYSHLDF